MMKTKLLLFFVGIFSLMTMTSCSDDDEKDSDEIVYHLDESTGPFTATVKYVTPEAGSVQVLITEIPESSNEYLPKEGSEAVITSSKDIKADIQVGDVIKFRIIDFKLLKERGVYSDSPRFIILKAEPYIPQEEIAIPNDSHLFIGKWKIESIEDMGTVSDYTNDNSIVTFYEDGRFAYTPYISKGIDGEVYGTYESSESRFQCSYEYTENELYVHNFGSGIIYFYTYKFSDDNDTLRLVLTRLDLDGNVCYIVPPTSPLIGKTLVLKKII